MRSSLIVIPVAVALALSPPATAAEPVPLAATDAGAGVGGPTARTLPAGTAAATATLRTNARPAIGLAAALSDTLAASLALAIPDEGVPIYPSDRLAGRAEVRARLARERGRRPAVAAGVTAGVSDGEPGAYLAASRTAGRADLHAGIGWGGLDGGVALPWSPGAVFGSVDLALPTSAPLWLRASLPPDRGRTGQVPVDVGLVWRARPWLDLEVALEEGRTAAFRAGVRYGLDGWRPLGPVPPAPRAGPGPTGRAALEPIGNAALVALARDAGLPVATIERTGEAMTVRLDVPHDAPAARVAGRTARLLTRHAPAGVERFDMALTRHGLPGTTATLYRRDVVRGANGRLGPESLWRRARPRPASPGRDVAEPAGRRWWLTVAPRAELDLTAPETPLAERYTLGLAGRLRPTARTLLGVDLRYGFADTLPFLRLSRSDPPVRSDPWWPVEGWTLERGFAAALAAPAPGLTVAASGGLLERDYAGAAVAGLWRPFAGRLAVEAEASAGRLREPWPWPRFAEPATWTGRVGLRWTTPGPGLDVTAGIDRFLAGDTGIDAGIARSFDNGVEIALEMTASAAAEGADHAVGAGLRITVPLLRGLAHAEARSELVIGPILRDAGQRPRLPVDIARLRRPVDYAGLARGWSRLFE